MILELHHVQLAMPKNREDDARALYSGILEFSEVAKPKELQGRGGVWFQSSGVRVHLGVEEPFSPAKKAHPGFRVASLADTIARLDRFDIPYHSDIDLPDIKRIYIADPFGNRIELLETTDV